MEHHILAIESSCDETSVAIISNGVIRSNIVETQKIHEEYGGVVPELASRFHHKYIIPLVDSAIQSANINKNQLSAIAFTRGPGLLGALLVGSSFAKSMALSLGLPLIGVHHMKAHILAHWIDLPCPKFPFLCLTLSGGHTQIVMVKDVLDMDVLGQTRDDAIGEAFDKCAKLLGLGYPGGVLIDQYAKEGDPKAFQFTISRMPGYDFSFSGIKTAVLYFLNKEIAKNPDFIDQNIHDLCASIQYTLVEMVIIKTREVLKKMDVHSIGIAGGVAANSALRTSLLNLGAEVNKPVYIPKVEYCTDNAAMIAQAAYFQFLEKDFVPLSVLPLPRWPFDIKINA